MRALRFGFLAATAAFLLFLLLSSSRASDDNIGTSLAKTTGLQTDRQLPQLVKAPKLMKRYEFASEY